jgi:prevent-host-death family protein
LVIEYPVPGSITAPIDATTSARCGFGGLAEHRLVRRRETAEFLVRLLDGQYAMASDPPVLMVPRRCSERKDLRSGGFQRLVMPRLRVTSAEFQNEFDRYLETALSEPIMITDDGQNGFVLMAADEYRRLERGVEHRLPEE